MQGFLIIYHKEMNWPPVSVAGNPVRSDIKCDNIWYGACTIVFLFELWADLVSIK